MMNEHQPEEKVVYQDASGKTRAIRGRIDTTTEPGWVLVTRTDKTVRIPSDRVETIRSSPKPSGAST